MHPAGWTSPHAGGEGGARSAGADCEGQPARQPEQRTGEPDPHAEWWDQQAGTGPESLAEWVWGALIQGS